MNIQKDCVVSFHYSVSEPRQEPLESSRDRQPLVILYGHGAIIPGLEQSLLGRAAGDSFEVEVPPDQAYGEYRDGMVQRVPRKHFKGAKLAPGMQVVLPTRDGQRPMTVLKVGVSVVDVDLNHPMAGKTLRFAVEVLDVREATTEEKDHGHAHGDGGHQH